MKVLIYPKARSNPYHRLLYNQLADAHPEDSFTYIKAGIRTAFLPFILLLRRLQGYTIFHLHWHGFYAPMETKLPTRGRISLAYTLGMLRLIHALGYKLVWTVHNILPHEPKTSDDARVARVTTQLAAKVIVHSAQALKDLHALGANTDRASIIPHGNYDGVYPQNSTRDKARKMLGLEPHETAILFFGQIHPYKGIEDSLLPAFTALRSTESAIRLIIAGHCQNSTLAHTISTSAGPRSKILFVNQLIPDDAVARYFKAADLVCLPFKTITTSGSAILAATFGKPIIAPSIGAFKDIPRGVGVLYDPAKPNALLDALRQALPTAARADMAKASRAYADTLSWKAIAERTYESYLSVSDPIKRQMR